MIQWTSVRVRLTLWNAGVLAAMLAAFGIAIYWDVRASCRSAQPLHYGFSERTVAPLFLLL